VPALVNLYMVVSETRNIVSLFKAIGFLLIIVSGLWGAMQLITSSKYTLLVYRYNIGSVPAYRFVERLSEAVPRKKNNVVFLGPSTVREGIDEELLAKLVPSHTFINTGVTSKGSVHLIEILLSIIEAYNIEIDHLVLGLNSRMLSSRFTPIGSFRYVDFLSYGQGLEFLQFVPTNEFRYTLSELKKNRLWPANKLSIRLNYLIRYGLFELQNTAKWETPLSIDAFARKGDPLIHHSRFLYTDQEHRHDELYKQMEGTRRRGLLSRGVYAKPFQIKSFRRSLDVALKIAPKVTVLIMPEHSMVRHGFGSYADNEFIDILNEYSKNGLKIFDMSDQLEDKYIRDMAHLLPQGREKLSTILAERLVSNHTIAKGQINE
jgi:hypothetical protein